VTGGSAWHSLTPPPGNHESAQIPQLRLQARGIRFRTERHPPSLIRSSGSALRCRLDPQGQRDPDRRPARRRQAEPAIQGLRGASGSTGRSDGAWAQMGTALNPQAGAVDPTMPHPPLRVTTLPIAMGPVNRSPK
jgi:hypothetical protein